MNELALRDIHLPDDQLWWPPAPGWWILLVTTIIFLIVIPRFWRWLRRQSVKKLSRNEFGEIVTSFKQHQDQQRLVTDLSILLRRIVMSYQGRRQIAGLTGNAWINQLNTLVEADCFSEEQRILLASGQYQRAPEYDQDALIDSCQRWIKALPGGTQHVSA